MLCRCRIGDLAIVIREHPGCGANLGKVVHVHRAGRPTLEEGACWVITPVHPHPWWFIEVDDCIVCCLITTDDNIVHPDAWLLPLRPKSAESIWWNKQKEIDRALLQMGAVDKNMLKRSERSCGPKSDTPIRGNDPDDDDDECVTRPITVPDWDT